MAATRDFFGGFENDSLGTLTTANGWIQTGGHAFGTVVASATDGILGPRTGSHMLRTNHEGGLVFESALTPVISYTDEIFYRFYLRSDNNHAGEPYPGIGAKYLRFFIQNATHIIDKFIALHNGGAGFTNSGQFGLFTDSQDTYFGGGDTTDNNDHWNKVEMYFNTTTGSCKIWQDGTLVTNVSGRTMGGLKADQIGLVSNGDTLGDSTNYMYFDDIEVFSDSGTGEATTGSMSDASIQVDEGGGGGGLLNRLHTEGLFTGD